METGGTACSITIKNNKPSISWRCAHGKLSESKLYYSNERNDLVENLFRRIVYIFLEQHFSYSSRKTQTRPTSTKGDMNFWTSVLDYYFWRNSYCSVNRKLKYKSYCNRSCIYWIFECYEYKCWKSKTSTTALLQLLISIVWNMKRLLSNRQFILTKAIVEYCTDKLDIKRS